MAIVLEWPVPQNALSLMGEDYALDAPLSYVPSKPLLALTHLQAKGLDDDPAKSFLSSHYYRTLPNAQFRRTIKSHNGIERTLPP